MARVDYDRQAARYDAARGAADDARLLWAAEVARAWPEPRGRLADIGAGTGQWAGLFARVLGVDVVGIEPSAGMRAAAVDLPSRVALVAGRAEQLPLATDAAGALWVSAVLHHLHDLGAFAREARRVARPGAPLLLRGFFPGAGEPEPDDIAALAAAAGLPGRAGYPRMFFPGVAAVLDSFPSVAELDEVVGAAGFTRASITWVPEILATSAAELVDRLSLRADTTLTLIADAEFTAGLARARAWSTDPAHDPATPIVAALPLLTYR